MIQASIDAHHVSRDDHPYLLNTVNRPTFDQPSILATHLLHGELCCMSPYTTQLVPKMMQTVWNSIHLFQLKYMPLMECSIIVSSISVNIWLPTYSALLQLYAMDSTFILHRQHLDPYPPAIACEFSSR